MGDRRRRAAMGAVADASARCFAATTMAAWIGLMVVVQNIAHLAAQFAFVRFPRGLDVRARRRRRRRHGAPRASGSRHSGGGLSGRRLAAAAARGDRDRSPPRRRRTATICGVMVSPLKNAASAKVMKGCSNCTCDTRAMPPIAMPAFQAKKPIHCENSGDIEQRRAMALRQCATRSAGMVERGRGQRDRQRDHQHPADHFPARHLAR